MFLLPVILTVAYVAGMFKTADHLIDKEFEDYWAYGQWSGIVRQIWNASMAVLWPFYWTGRILIVGPLDRLLLPPPGDGT